MLSLQCDEISRVTADADTRGPLLTRNDPPTRSGAGEIRGELARSIYEWWRHLGAESEIPRRSDFLAESLANWWRHVELLDVVGAPEAPRFRIRVSGQLFNEMNGANLAGRYLDEALEGQWLDNARFTHMGVLEARRPVYTLRCTRGADGIDYAYEKLVLPLSDDGSRITQLISFLSVYASQFRPVSAVPQGAAEELGFLSRAILTG